MDKKNTRQLILGGAALVIYLVLTLVIPFPKTAAFWIAFVFGLIAIAAQVYVMKAAFEKGEPVKSKFYGYPIARIGILYLAVQLVVSFVLMAVGFACNVPAWIAVVLCVVVTGVSLIGFISADIMRDEVEHQDNKLKTDVHTMRALQSKTADIAGLCSDADTRKVLAALADKFRFSDPVSSDATRELETGLTAAVDELQAAVVDGDLAAAKQLCTKLEASLNERNRICKLNKQKN